MHSKPCSTGNGDRPSEYMYILCGKIFVYIDHLVCGIFEVRDVSPAHNDAWGIGRQMNVGDAAIPTAMGGNRWGKYSVT